MASESSLDNKVSSGRFYMNKIFGRGMENARALDHSSADPLGAVRRVTIEPHSSGGHRVLVERSAVSLRGARPGASVDRIGSSLSTEHSFARVGDALRFLDSVLTDREPIPSAGSGEAGRFLDQVLDDAGITKI